jgi:hypothetical protein
VRENYRLEEKQGERRRIRHPKTEQQKERQSQREIPSQKYTSLTQTLASIQPPKESFQVWTGGLR